MDMPWIAVVLELDMRWSSHKGYVLGKPRRIRIRWFRLPTRLLNPANAVTSRQLEGSLILGPVQLALPFNWLVAASVLQDRLPVGASALLVAYPDGCSALLGRRIYGLKVLVREGYLAGVLPYMWLAFK